MDLKNGMKLVLKIFLWTTGSILLLILLIFILIQVPAIQDFARRKTVSFLQNKLKTKVEVSKLSIDFPKLVVLKGVLFEDQSHDTLLSGDVLKVDISLFKLLKNQVQINEIKLQGITVNVQRTLPDSTFNFDYILKAFNTTPVKNASDTAAGMKISLDKITLDRITVSLKDAVTANDIRIHINHFNTRFREFDLDKMRFSVPIIRLAGLNAVIVQSKPALKQERTAKVEAESNIPFDLDLKLGTIDLSQIKIDYQNDISNLKTKLDLGQLLVDVESINLKKQRIALKSIVLANTGTEVLLGKSEQAKVVVKEVKKVAKATLNNDWRVTVGKADFSNINLKYDDFNQPVQQQGMDFAHLGITDFNLHAADFTYSMDTISGRVAAGSLKNKDDFVLKALHTEFVYSKTGVVLNNLYLETPGSTVRNYLRIGYPSLETLLKDPGIMSINARLLNSRISFKDILTFVPQLADVDPFKNNHTAIVNITGTLSGNIAKLNIPDLLITGFGNTRINASGNITGLPDMNRSKFDITIHEFKSGSADLNQLLSPGIIPESIRIPEVFIITGKFNGGISSFRTNLDMSSTYGAAKVSAGLQNGNQKGNEIFNASIELTGFNAGHLFKQDSVLGLISGQAQVNGTGMDPETMNAHFTVVASSAELKGYAYKNLVLNGNIADQNLDLAAKMNDPNLQFNIDAKAIIKNKYPSVNFTLNIDTLNLQKLNLYDSDLRFKGKIVADFLSTNPDSLIGTLNAGNLLVTANEKRYQLDSINIIATLDGEQKVLLIKSEVLTASLTGKYNLTEISSALTNEINTYFKIGDSTELPVSKAQDFSFAAKFTNHPIVQEFVPHLTHLEPVEMKGTFNSVDGGLKLEATTAKIIYSGISADNVSLMVKNSEDALNYKLNMDGISASSFKINKTSLSGKVKSNTISVNLKMADQSDKDKYQLAGLFSAIDNQYQFSFNPDGLMLNYDSWTVTPANFVQFGPEGIMAGNLNLSGKGQELSVNSNPRQVNAPLKVDFTDFKISTLTAIAETDTILADGIINGNVVLENLDSSPVFIGDLKIKDFSFRADTLGDISLKVNNSEANTYAANVNITGKGNDILLDGKYFQRPENKSSFDFGLDIGKLNLATVEGLSMGNLKDASGNINGKLKITGTLAAPAIRGDLYFDKTAFNIAMLNSYYKIENEKVSFTAEGIHFDTFTLVDPAGNKAVIDGSVYTTNYMDYRFGLDVTATDFKVLSSTQKDNRLFWGEVFLNSNLQIRGDTKSPVVEGSVKVNKGTHLTVVVPQTAPGVADREGIVEFVDMDLPQTSTDLTEGLDSLNRSTLTGMDISVNVEVDSNAVFNIIIDEGSGDFLEVQGDARLTAGIDQSGKVNLAGIFEVTKGAYELSFNFLKRRFVIEKGSVITWQGEPTKADVNVTAVYVANTAPYDLVISQLDEPPATLNRYKQKLPFEVTLNMQGMLMKPVITFDINLPNRNYSVARDVVDNVQFQLTRLKTQPSELNKQVFALLLLNRFVAENPFVSGAGSSGVESLARSSASKILSEQMNQLAGNLIEGVDLNFDLVSSEDYTTGALQNRTDLNVGLSKKLINDRLKVSIGSNFELEGPRNADQSATNIAGNVALDYQLSRDGRYMLRAYRKNEYQGVAEGYIIETGIGFIFTLDYNVFRELFARKSDEEKKRLQIEKDKIKKDKQEEKLKPVMEK